MFATETLNALNALEGEFLPQIRRFRRISFTAKGAEGETQRVGAGMKGMWDMRDGGGRWDR